MSRTRLAIIVALAGVIIGSLASTSSPAVATIKSSPQKVVVKPEVIVAKQPTVTTKETAPAVVMQSSGGYWVQATRFPSALSTLSGISQVVYGTARNWQGLCNANKITNCDSIAVGQRVFAPPANELNNTAPARPAQERSSRASSNVPTGWIHPLASGQRGTSCWGDSRDGGSRSHQGVDMPQPSGTAIRAVRSGRVIYSQWSNGGGNTVAVDHGNGIQSVYMHLVSRGLPVGTNVNTGSVIGRVGNTGNSFGAHLHFEIHKGLWKNRVNPATFMRSVGVNIGC